MMLSNGIMFGQNKELYLQKKKEKEKKKKKEKSLRIRFLENFFNPYFCLKFPILFNTQKHGVIVLYYFFPLHCTKNEIFH